MFTESGPCGGRFFICLNVGGLIQNYIEKNAIKYDIIEIIFGRSVIWIFTH
jgi:hypothetical protein